jgi:hypothetical protein
MGIRKVGCSFAYRHILNSQKRLRPLNLTLTFKYAAFTSLSLLRLLLREKIRTLQREIQLVGDSVIKLQLQLTS